MCGEASPRKGFVLWGSDSFLATKGFVLWGSNSFLVTKGFVLWRRLALFCEKAQFCWRHRALFCEKAQFCWIHSALFCGEAQLCWKRSALLETQHLFWEAQSLLARQSFMKIDNPVGPSASSCSQQVPLCRVTPFIPFPSFSSELCGFGFPPHLPLPSS